MKKLVKIISVTTIVCFVLIILFPIPASATSTLELTDEEQTFVETTNNKKAIKIGIIPHTFPLSDCPPDASDYVGINIEMLNLIAKKTGLCFEYGRIPLETKTPYQSLLNNEFTFVAGTIRLDSFINNPELVISERFCDGSSICIALKDTNPKNKKTGKVAVMSGYQAGMDFSKQQFPGYELVLYKNNQDVMKAVRTGEADVAMISRYVGIYELQNPLNEQLTTLSPYQVIVDSCIMGINNKENKIAISIINKALEDIGEEEYNHIQVSFSLSHPYNLTIFEYLYKYRYIFIIGTISLSVLVFLGLKLLNSQKDKRLLSRDKLTGAYTESGFELAAKKIIQKSTKPLFVTVFDISHFSGFNDLHGKDKGDELLKKIVDIVSSYLSEQDVICRSYADNFRVLSCKNSVEELIADIRNANKYFNELLDSKMIFSFGIYQINDPKIPISKMIDFATMAKKHIKGNTSHYIHVFNDELLENHMSDAKLIGSFNKAILNHEFVAYYQPKYDVYTQKIIGAEALVRWVLKDGTIIPPIEFIELFEKNGQIQHLDFYMLEQVCLLQRSLIDKKSEVIPISVNFSRVHLYSDGFISKLKETVEKYDIPKSLIQIECTETVMTYDTDLAKDILGQLQGLGFTIAMDDFGKAYSALNTLRSMPLDIIKLDSDFLQVTLDEEIEKSNRIIAGIVNLVHDLSLKIIAEGVETKEQYLFLKSIGCDYIQGYYFSRPLKQVDFLTLLAKND